ncbi:hypothetical protein J1N35_043647 [Gossypium stocksii]|uniref:Uncharacterized protein n=1 Tax=Gossypium stocksii TaxID=47602 RepID=A0A9D3U822_9ROSI|nr:hypothetical protein J1N35_043647 [Gossypium stocksii]
MRTKKGVELTCGRIVNTEQKRKEKSCADDSVSNSPLEQRSYKPTYDGLIRFKNKRKRFRGTNGDTIDESLLKIGRRRLMENVSPSKTVAGDQPRQEQ